MTTQPANFWPVSPDIAQTTEHYMWTVRERLRGEVVEIDPEDVDCLAGTALAMGISAEDLCMLILDHVRWMDQHMVIDRVMDALCFVDSLEDWAEDLAEDLGWYDVLRVAGIPTHMFDTGALIRDHLAGGEIIVLDNVCNFTGRYKGKVIFTPSRLEY